MSSSRNFQRTQSTGKIPIFRKEVHKPEYLLSEPNEPDMLNDLFQQYQARPLSRDLSTQDFYKRKSQQFKSLIIQQKQKQNNIGSIINQLSL